MNVLVSLLSGGRETGNMVDKTQAKIDAQTLITMGPKKWLDKDVSYFENLVGGIDNAETYQRELFFR